MPTEDRVSRHIPRSTRFEVFKRDSFTCQYCGATPQRVVLEVDHIKPWSDGGDNTLLNLITACRECNGGKGARHLSDDSVVARQQAQLEELNEKRLQLEMMLAWREGLKDLREQEVDAVAAAFSEAVPGYHVSEGGRKKINKWLDKHTVLELMDAAKTSASWYLDYGDDGKVTQETANKTLDGILIAARRSRLPAHEQRLPYIRGILRNRMYVDERIVMDLLRGAIDAGVRLEDLEDFAKKSDDWSQVREELERVIRGESVEDHQARKAREAEERRAGAAREKAEREARWLEQQERKRIAQRQMIDGILGFLAGTPGGETTGSVLKEAGTIPRITSLADLKKSKDLPFEIDFLGRGQPTGKSIIRLGRLA